MEGRQQAGTALVIALLITLLLFVLGTALLGLSGAERQIAANDEHAEGAFQAAEAAVQVAADQLAVGTTGLPVAETVIGGVYTFRSGGREDMVAQPPQLVSTTSGAGYAIAATTGYNSTGYVFQVFELKGTGTGPRNTEREVEVQVEIGPVNP